MLIADGCELLQATAGCSSTPTMDQYAVEVAKAVKDLLGTYFSAGAPAVLALLVVLWVLSRVIPWVFLLLGGRVRKGD